MERKYRQRGYQDDASGGRETERKDRPQKAPGAPRTPMSHERPRSPQMPARRGVVRCAGCGTLLVPDIDPALACPRCKFELHSCKQCVNFDTGARWECIKPIPQRITKKDAKNDCTFFELKVTFEKETSSAPLLGTPAVPGGAVVTDARQAFENLFKK